MQTKKTVEIANALRGIGARIVGTRNRNRRTLAIIFVLAIRHDNVERIRRAAQKQTHQHIAARRGVLRRER
ncbi:MAG: hypothetical protein HDKAJFGB_01350 [Anaerolineae bacterium]|nr:hypothetical protein [Anaerolineae bacterium]